MFAEKYKYKISETPEVALQELQLQECIFHALPGLHHTWKMSGLTKYTDYMKGHRDDSKRYGVICNLVPNPAYILVYLETKKSSKILTPPFLSKILVEYSTCSSIECVIYVSKLTNNS